MPDQHVQERERDPVEDLNYRARAEAEAERDLLRYERDRYREALERIAKDGEPSGPFAVVLAREALYG